MALGWGGAEALVVAGVVGISSSAIVTKLLVELKRLANPETKLILGVIVVEDVFLALYLAALQPLLSDTTGWAAVWSFAKAVLFLLALTAVARWGGRLVGRLLGPSDDELLTVAFLGLALLVAGLAEQAGVSEAIGAFMIGMVIAESPVAGRVERLVRPLRDSFAAVFFFTFGLTVDPGDVASVAGPVFAAVVLTLGLAVAAGYGVGRVNDLRPRGAANLALTLVSRGESPSSWSPSPSPPGSTPAWPRSPRATCWSWPSAARSWPPTPSGWRPATRGFYRRGRRPRGDAA